MLVEHYPVSVGVIAGIVIAITGIFVLSMPMYRSPIDKAMLTPATQPAYTLPRVQKIFAANGAPLGSTDGLYVVLAGSRGSAPRDAYSYEKRVGNVVVHYGGGDGAVLKHVRAAVAALSRG
ncbi:MAG: hypothetical protein QOF43_2096 [Gaiellaceae bacterium]|nr:hypothetical protein [Gaiellaceae bacterium]